jgi:hypothetical protein
MSNSLLALAIERFSGLTQAELCVLDSASNGQVAICSNDANDANPMNWPGNCAAWNQERAVQSALIEWLCSPLPEGCSVNRKGIHIYGAKIYGVLNLGYARIQFPLTFHRCAFEEDVSFKNARTLSLILPGCWTKTVLADGIEIANNVTLTDGFHSDGEVLFRDASVGGGFRTDGGFFQYAPGAKHGANTGNALGCDRMKVNGTIFLSTAKHPSTYKGEVGLAGAYSGSNIECDGGTFENPGGFAIRADRLTAAGTISFRTGFSAKGVVHLPNSKMQALDCTSGKFEGDGTTAINAEGATAVGPVVFDQSETRSGSIGLRGIEAGDVSFKLCRLSSLDLRHARIHRTFRWQSISKPQATILDLRDASSESIEDEVASWPSDGDLYLDGLTYGGFAASPTDVYARLNWIRLDKSNPPRAYKQLASAYSTAGETRSSRETLFHLEELLHLRQLDSLRFGPFKLILSAWNQLLKWTIGYGYKLERAFGWMFLLTLFGFFISSIGYKEKIIVPTDKDAFVFFMAHGNAPDSYQRFSSLIYSVEHSIPAINLGVSTSWSADPVAQSPGHPFYVYQLRWWFWTQTLIGWGLSIFFIAGITGLVKSDK